MQIAFDFRKNLKALAADMEDRCRIARRAHFLASERWGRMNLVLGVVAVLTGIIGGGTAGAGGIPFQVTVVFSTAAGLLGGAMSFFKPSDREEKHKRAGDNWSILRDQFTDLRCLRTDREDTSEKELQEQYSLLLNQKEQATRDSPVMPDWAYKKALKKIEKDPTYPDSLPSPEASHPVGPTGKP